MHTQINAETLLTYHNMQICTHSVHIETNIYVSIKVNLIFFNVIIFIFFHIVICVSPIFPPLNACKDWWDLNLSVHFYTTTFFHTYKYIYIYIHSQLTYLASYSSYLYKCPSASLIFKSLWAENIPFSIIQSQGPAEYLIYSTSVINIPMLDSLHDNWFFAERSAYTMRIQWASFPDETFQ